MGARPTLVSFVTPVDQLMSHVCVSSRPPGALHGGEQAGLPGSSPLMSSMSQGVFGLLTAAAAHFVCSEMKTDSDCSASWELGRMRVMMSWLNSGRTSHSNSTQILTDRPHSHHLSAVKISRRKSCACVEKALLPSAGQLLQVHLELRYQSGWSGFCLA